MMNTYEIGRNFEEDAFVYLKKSFKNVVWLSKDSFSTFDFRCDTPDGYVLYGDAKMVSKADKPVLNYSQRDADFVIAKIKGDIKLILKKDFDKRVLIKQTELVSIYPDRKFRKDLEKLAKKDDRSLNNYIISILTKYVRNDKK